MRGYTPIYAPRHPHPLVQPARLYNSFLFTVSKKEFIHFVNVFFCIFSLSSCSCLMRPCSKPWTGAAIARCCVWTVASSTRCRSLWSETNFSFFHTRFWRYKALCFPFFIHLTNLENSGWGCLVRNCWHEAAALRRAPGMAHAWRIAHSANMHAQDAAYAYRVHTRRAPGFPWWPLNSADHRRGKFDNERSVPYSVVRAYKNNTRCFRNSVNAIKH